MDRTTAVTQQEWQQARRSAFVQDILGALRRRQTDLLSFEEVRQKLQLHDVHYLGVQDVRLDRIVGSVGRYRDFTRAFFPRQSSLEDRWLRIDRLVTTGIGLPPIELYKIGEAYFVRDGNHRVSVARQHGTPAIKAHVWEYETDVTLEACTGVDDWLCKSAHAEFVKRTNVGRLCPDVNIELTQSDGYEDLLDEMQAYQRSLSKIDERDVPFDEAVTLWCEMRFTPIVDIIRQRGILGDFPGRTEADLYLWLCRNQEELAAQYGHRVSMDEAASGLPHRHGQKFSSFRRVRQIAGRAVRGVGELIVGWLRRWMGPSQ